MGYHPCRWSVCVLVIPYLPYRYLDTGLGLNRLPAARRWVWVLRFAGETHGNDAEIECWENQPL